MNDKITILNIEMVDELKQIALEEIFNNASKRKEFCKKYNCWIWFDYNNNKYFVEERNIQKSIDK